MKNGAFGQLRQLAKAIPGAPRLVNWVRRRTDPELQAIETLRRDRGDALFQPFPTTSEDRYPELFAALALRLARVEHPRLLSFGCSDGSEVRTLRRWFPKAQIVGIDINPRSIAQARRQLAAAPDPGIRFELAADAAAEPPESFDAVLALAVFRHGELERDMPASCARILPFARFAEGAAMLDRVIRPGGWLALWNAHYRFGDTPTAAGYRAESLPWSEGDPLTILYGADDRLVTGSYAEVLFRKTG